ncbi:MAG: family 1 glycosylhydrolase [Nanopusillaceae archaeon]
MEKFFLGFSISAYQTEGDNFYSDWYYFENDKLPKSGKACNLWENYEKIIQFLVDLKVNAFRFSIEWSRIFPEENNFSQENLNRYLRFIEKLKEKNIEPFICLWHFTNPKWFFDKGGWQYRENINYFIEYVDILIKNLKKYDVKYFITFNEPFVYTLNSYVLGFWPPFEKISSIENLKKISDILENFHLAHKEVYKIIKESDEKIIYIENFSFFNFYLIKFFKDTYLDLIISTLPKKVDGIGVNYYGILVDYTTRKFYESLKYFSKVLDKLKTKNKDIFITENGISTEDEYKRAKYIKKHLTFVLNNRKKYNIKGYFIWSLLDNYEWEIGYKAKFGILTREIKPKDSYYELKEFFKSLKIS